MLDLLPDERLRAKHPARVWWATGGALIVVGLWNWVLFEIFLIRPGIDSAELVLLTFLAALPALLGLAYMIMPSNLRVARNICRVVSMLTLVLLLLAVVVVAD